MQNSISSVLQMWQLGTTKAERSPARTCQVWAMSAFRTLRHWAALTADETFKASMVR